LRGGSDAGCCYQYCSHLFVFRVKKAARKGCDVMAVVKPLQKSRQYDHNKFMDKISTERNTRVKNARITKLPPAAINFTFKRTNIH